MKRRVLVLNHFAVPRGSAGGTRHVELFSRLKGWSAFILAADRNSQTRRLEPHREPGFQTVPTTPLSGSNVSRIVNWASYAISAFLAGVSRGGRLDVVYGSSPHLLAGLAGLAIARLRHARFILEIRDIWPLILVEMDALPASSPIYMALERLERYLYQQADRIVILAEGTARRLDECCVPASRICFIPNGAEPADFVPTVGRDEAREQLGVDDWVFIYAGAHGPANGLDLFLDAAAEIQSELPQAQFLLVGDGPAKHDLVRRAEEEGLSCIRFLDPVPKEALPNLFAACDAGIHVLADVPLFRYGVSPNKLHDYMAAGLPVITNTPGEVAKLVREAGAGLTVEPGEMADGIRRFVAATDVERRTWAGSGRSFMELNRSRTILAHRLEDLLDEVAT